ncbi:TetR/AcrR family transcriptional regulator [Flocculibacter collagenilyticus]|uniref:TetR/AcrR family transcriptional regulator n=1 Tax=Flocculibacter collagenilyticus TaxID=2744479 RepID=UPI0018F434A7|nr:TetR/AcrR family transcriptional regulator [Flocculibacter collagenilyticus]
MKTKDKIIEASITLFNQLGEPNVTTNHIAAHLNISPGNLYYHFRNKDDIIRSIFKLYARHMETQFEPVADKAHILDNLKKYMDAVFELMGRFSFFYDNLPVILARSPALKTDYLKVQEQVLVKVESLVNGLKNANIINIEDDDVTHFSHNVKQTVSFWISYFKTQSDNPQVGQQELYQGVTRVLLLFKPHFNLEYRYAYDELEAHYRTMAAEK